MWLAFNFQNWDDKMEHVMQALLLTKNIYVYHVHNNLRQNFNYK